jgi:hypothetical protein
MSADKHDRHSVFVNASQRLEEFHKDHPDVFALVAPSVGLAALGTLELIELIFRRVLR